jgi:hypothetical protein
MAMQLEAAGMSASPTPPIAGINSPTAPAIAI